MDLPQAITLDAAGNIYFIDSETTNAGFGVRQVIRRIDAVTGMLTAIAGQNFNGTAYDSTDGGGTCTLGGYSLVSYQCGDGGLASYAFLRNIYNLALDSAGNLYIEVGGYGQLTFIREINAATGIITTVASPTALNSTEGYGGMTMGSDGNLYILAIDQTAQHG